MIVVVGGPGPQEFCGHINFPRHELYNWYANLYISDYRKLLFVYIFGKEFIVQTC